MTIKPTNYKYSFHIALDGNGVNGLEGLAGVCIFQFDPDDNSYAYKIRYFDGVAAGHSVSLNPNKTVGFLGNVGQHLMFYDPRQLDELDRISTLRFESIDTSLQGTTHLAWLNDSEFICAIGEYFYKFQVGSLQKGERIAKHRVMLPHAMKLTKSGRFLCYGSMDSPRFGRAGEARHVGIMDLVTGVVKIVTLPATCWHVLPHKTDDLFYAVSFRVFPADDIDYQEWAMAFLKEYVFEISARDCQVIRHWAAGREIPAHINSDMTLSDSELIFCNGGSQTIVCLDLETFSKFRLIDERPDVAMTLAHPREVATQIYDVFARGNFFTNTRHFFSALRVSRFSLLDSVYACQLSKDQRFLFTANRGLNHITVYDYPANTIRLRVQMPPLQEYVSHLDQNADPRLGFHHSVVTDLTNPASSE